MVEGYGGGGGGFRGGFHFGGRVGVAVLNGSIGLVDLEGRREPKAGRGVCSGLFARRSNLGKRRSLLELYAPCEFRLPWERLGSVVLLTRPDLGLIDVIARARQFNGKCPRRNSRPGCEIT